MSRSRLILHPSDFSPASRPALAQAIAAAKAQRAQLLVVHVLAPSIPIWLTATCPRGSTTI